MEWETVIGLEVHTQLATQTKIFSGAACAYGAEPNTQACAIDLGLPGVLPVLNEQAVVLAIRLGLSIGAEIPTRSVFARKNYFYPDLPKGYQISQYEFPIVGQGRLLVTLEDGTEKTIGITRAHLEEDAGKSLHENLEGVSGIDLNRAGTPLLEIVSEPDMRSAKEAIAYLKTLHTLVRYLGVSDGNMQEGSFRCDVNISLRPFGQKKFGTRTELKNLNSFRFIERAIAYEIARQQAILENDGTITQETRLYDADNDVTRPMRSKEEANDYRYFPDPDLLPLIVSRELVETVRQTLPELPWEKLARFQNQYQLSAYDAKILTATQASADYFEALLTHDTSINPKIAANWMNGDLAAALNKAHLGIEASPISSQQLAQLLKRIADNTISAKMAKEVFIALWDREGEVDAIIASKGMQQVTDHSAIEAMIDAILNSYPAQLAEYRSGKDKLLSFFVGQVMKACKGQANPQVLNDLLRKKLAG